MPEDASSAPATPTATSFDPAPTPLPPEPAVHPEPDLGVPVSSWDELQQTRAIEYIECALEAAIAESKGWFDPTHFSELITKEIVGHMRPLDRVDLFVPAVIEVGCGQQSCAGQDRVKATGQLTPGLAVARDHDVILAWGSGVVRFKTGSVVVPYSSVVSAAAFSIRAKLSTLPAAEVITHAGRVSFTFSNNLRDEAGADPTIWRDVLVERFRGATPVFDGYRVASRTPPTGSAPAPVPDHSVPSQPLVEASSAEQAQRAPVLTPGWHADPWRVATYRWHDGVEWTEHTS